MKKGLLVLMAIACVFLLTFNDDAKAEEPKYGGILKMIHSRQVGSAIVGIPWKMTLGTNQYFYMASDTLVDMDHKAEIHPRLAKSWEWAPDGLSITFKLRDDVMFHDGTPFNAEALKWNLEQYLAAKKTGTDVWKSVEVLDPYTLRLNLKQYTNALLPIFAGPNDYPGFISPTAYEKNGEEWAKSNLVSTGPFKLVDSDRDVGMKFVRNDNYWVEGRPYLDGIEVVFNKEALSAAMAFRRGDAHLINLMRGGFMSLKDELIKAGFYSNPWLSGGGIYTFFPDTINAESPLADKKVREAIEYAIDKEGIVDTLGFGMWTVAYQFAGKNSMGYNDAIEPRKYNPEKSKQLLAEAGYKPGELEINLYLQASDTDLGEAMQAMIQNIGINCNVQVIAFATYSGMARKGWKNGYLLYSAPPQPYHLATLSRMFKSPPEASYAASVYRSPEFVQALLNAYEARDDASMRARTQGVVKMVYDEVMCLPMFEHEGNFLTDAKKLHDAKICAGPVMWWDTANAWLSE